ncbi:SDR family oxidoreductase [Humidisolicoccus flavus]|uniref:SDR family oxidoreductase n=1 Tax=Humidisolicoccus flavus TaxID=3111414 RepID=UPI0032460E45
MNIAVIGGTGLIGRKVVRRLARAGHSPVAVSRSGRSIAGSLAATADIVLGDGLAEAFEGVELVIDVSNTSNPLDARVFTVGARNVIDAAVEAGVRRSIVLSIVGVQSSNYLYHRRKADQEVAYAESALDTTVVRASQFHEFPVSFFEAGAALGAIPVFLGARFQTVDSGEVADLIVAQVDEPVDGGLVEIAGPKVQVSRDLAKIWRDQKRARGLIVNGPFPPQLLKFFRDGANLAGPDTVLGTRGFAEWLETSDRTPR